jgi:serine/threonine protein kinase KIN1/2
MFANIACKDLISRMLVSEVNSRATLTEVMNHPWMTKGFNGPVQTFIPQREPLLLPLDDRVIARMTGLGFGNQEQRALELTGVIQSEEYQSAVRSVTSKHNLYDENYPKKKHF